MKNRKFDIWVQVQPITITDEFQLTLSLTSIFKDSEFPDEWKNLEEGIYEPKTEDERQRFISMIYNFIKRNVEEKG